MVKFKVGDKVLCTHRVDGRDSIVGRQAKVAGLYANGVILALDFGVDIRGHGCDGLVKKGHGWNVEAEFVKLTRPLQMENK